MKTMHMHKDSESRLLIICMTRIFPSLVASTRETQIELWRKPVLGCYVVEFVYLGEGREEKSFKQVAAVGCFEILIS